MAFRQIAVSLISSSTLLTSGMHLGYSAVAVPLLEGEDDYLTVEQRSWFASIGTIATIVGCLMCGPLLDKLGRKWTLISVNVPFIIGWIILWAAPRPASAPLLYVGRLLTGLGGGMVSIPANVYIAEIATKSMRCMLVAWPSIAVSLGITLVYLFGWIIPNDWRLVAGVCLICPVLTSILLYFTLNESPTWLVDKGRTSEAEDSLKWIRNINKKDSMPEEVRNEYESIIQSIRSQSMTDQCDDNAMESNKKIESYWGRMKEMVSLLCRSDAWKPLVILNLYFFFMQLGGINVMMSYTVNIMLDVGIKLDPYLGTFILGALLSFCGAITTLLLNRFGRRPMSIISGIGMTACMILMGIYTQLMENGINEQHPDLSWIPLFLLTVWTITSSSGFRLIPWAMVGEVYPTRIRGLAGGITTCIAYIYGFIAVKFYPDMVTLLGGDVSSEKSDLIKTTPGVFYLFGFISLVGTFFVIAFLPETLNKSLEEIRRVFLKKTDQEIQSKP